LLFTVYLQLFMTFSPRVVKKKNGNNAPKIKGAQHTLNSEVSNA